MEDQVKQISEIFAAPRGDLYLVMNYRGVKIYTSNKLKISFLKAMAKTSRTKPIASTVAKLMMNNEFVPCYLTDSVTKSILKKQPPSLKHNAGITINGDIYVFVEAESNIFSFASNSLLSITTIHELIHASAMKFMKQFYQTFKPELIDFYSFYWGRIFSLESNSVSDKEIENIVSFLNFQLTSYKNHNNKGLKNYYDMLVNTFQSKTTLDENTFIKLVNEYITLLNIFWKAEQINSPDLILKAAMSHKSIITPLYDTYKAVFNVDPLKMTELCFQELFIPHEVISITSVLERPSPKVYKMINKL